LHPSNRTTHAARQRDADIDRRIAISGPNNVATDIAAFSFLFATVATTYERTFILGKSKSVYVML